MQAGNGNHSCREGASANSLFMVHIRMGPHGVVLIDPLELWSTYADAHDAGPGSIVIP